MWQAGLRHLPLCNCNGPHVPPSGPIRGPLPWAASVRGPCLLCTHTPTHAPTSPHGDVHAQHTHTATVTTRNLVFQDKGSQPQIPFTQAALLRLQGRPIESVAFCGPRQPSVALLPNVCACLFEKYTIIRVDIMQNINST